MSLIFLHKDEATDVNRSNEATAGNDNDTSSPQAHSYSLFYVKSNVHPLFLHNNNHLGMILISKKLIGTKNYGSWKRSMQITLSAKNKLTIVNENYHKPTANKVLFNQWERVNDMMIMDSNCVSDDWNEICK